MSTIEKAHKTYFRSSNISIYVDIARSCMAVAKDIYRKLVNEDEKIEKCQDEDEASYLHHQSMPLRNGLSKNSIQSIVFSAMSLEAYIYDYAARALTDSFVSQHLDKIDLASKYVVIFQLVTHEKFPKDTKVYNLLKKLIKNRNSLIHSKSNKINIEDHDSLLKLSNSHYHIYNWALDAVEAIDLVIKYVEKIDPEEHVSIYLS
jgi:hypothetical protein